MLPLYNVVLVSFVTLITMVNPLAVVPSFIALTDGASRITRARVAFAAAAASIVVLTAFLVAGDCAGGGYGATPSNRSYRGRIHEV